MALFVRQDEQRTQLQEKLAGELKDKLKSGQIQSDEHEPVILENEHQTRPAGFIIMVLVVILVAATVVTMYLINQ